MAMAMVTTTMAQETMIARKVTTLDQATMALAMVTTMALEKKIARGVTTWDQATIMALALLTIMAPEITMALVTTMALAMVTFMAPETIMALALLTTTALAQNTRGNTYISYGCMSSFKYGSDWINKSWLETRKY